LGISKLKKQKTSPNYNFNPVHDLYATECAGVGKQKDVEEGCFFKF